MKRILSAALIAAVASLLVVTPLRAGDGLLPGATDQDPLTIEANRLDMKDSRKLLIYTGDIVVANGPSTLKSADLTIHLDNAATGAGSTTDRVKSIEANGPVVINTQKEAYSGNRLQYDRQKNKIFMSGNVTIQQGEGLTRADHLEFDKASNSALLTGNVVFQKGAATVKGERLIYDQARDKILVTNNVVYVSGETSVTGRKMDFDRKANTALFMGNVVYVKKDTVVRGDSMEYNLTTNQGVVRTGAAPAASVNSTGAAAAAPRGNRVKAIFTPGQGKGI
jgi:lipopolysaccharide export system protein LptA